LASGGDDKAVRVWEIKTGRLLGESPAHKGSVCAVAISPNGKFLASGCGAETIKLWWLDRVSEAPPEDSVSHHKSVIRTLAFSPDGKTLASGSEDNTVKLWKLDLSGSRPKLWEVASFKHEAHLRLVVFSPDGNALASVTDQGTLRVFRAATLKEADEDWNVP
jgi:WD40 repeat protein